MGPKSELDLNIIIRSLYALFYRLLRLGNNYPYTPRLFYNRLLIFNTDSEIASEIGFLN